MTNDPKMSPEPVESAPKAAPPRLLHVRAGVKAGALQAYFSKVVGEKQGSFTGGQIQKG